MEISELYDLFLQHPQVTTDSRDCPAGSLFFALKGESFDGNKFATAALDKGCSYAIVDEAEYATDDRCILVDDSLKTLQQLARHHRRALGTKIVCITGTNGKTTTKELTAAVLGEKYKVLFTQGNFNNEIGVPKTLLTLSREHEIAVVEAGASHPGDIKILVDIIEPDYGIITNVGKAHLQGFGSFEGVVRTKGELYDFLRAKGGAKVFVNEGDENLMRISEGLERVKYGLVGEGCSKEKASSDACSKDDSSKGAASDRTVEGEVIACDPLLRFRWHLNGGEWMDVNTHLIGAYNIYNMLAAATIGSYFGVSEEQICHALSSYVPTNNRSELKETAHNRLIIDAYNANPTSMMAALKNFRDMVAPKKFAILGDMRELGEVSHEEHQKVVDFLSDLLAAGTLDKVWLVGDEFGASTIKNDKITTFKNVEEVKDAIGGTEGYTILIKGSNGIKLFQLPELL